MSGGTAGVRGTGAECRKFAPNIFNKSKCSSCFKQKEEHSAEALECNRSYACVLGPSRAGILSFLLAHEFFGTIRTRQKDESPVGIM
ncbi:Protein outspread [Apis mellifera carnica]|nr:Protein outspread [Apis mellifera carnica]